MIAKSRSELIKRVVKELSSPAVKIKEITNGVVLTHCTGDVDKVDIDIYAGAYSIIVKYNISLSGDYIVENGLSTSKGNPCFQAMTLTTRSPAYNKFKAILEERLANNV